MFRFIAALAVALILSGCTTTRTEQIAEAQETCRAYGFSDGTRQFSECVMQIDTARQEQARAAMAGYLMSQQSQRPVTCNTTANVYGTSGTSSTTCQ